MINTQPPPQAMKFMKFTLPQSSLKNFKPVKSSVKLNIKAIQKLIEARNILKTHTRGLEWASAQTQTKMRIDHYAMWILM